MVWDSRLLSQRGGRAGFNHHYHFTPPPSKIIRRRSRSHTSALPSRAEVAKNPRSPGGCMEGGGGLRIPPAARPVSPEFLPWDRKRRVSLVLSRAAGLISACVAPARLHGSGRGRCWGWAGRAGPTGRWLAACVLRILPLCRPAAVAAGVGGRMEASPVGPPPSSLGGRAPRKGVPRHRGSSRARGLALMAQSGDLGLHWLPCGGAEPAPACRSSSLGAIEAQAFRARPRRRAKPRGEERVE